MNWIKTNEQIPEEEELVLLSDIHGEVYLGHIIDLNRRSRENTRNRKAKYPVRYAWREYAFCCNYEALELDTFPFWAKRPEGPIQKMVCPDWCKSPHEHIKQDDPHKEERKAAEILIEVLKKDKK